MVNERLTVWVDLPDDWGREKVGYVNTREEARYALEALAECGVDAQVELGDGRALRVKPDPRGGYAPEEIMYDTVSLIEAD